MKKTDLNVSPAQAEYLTRRKTQRRRTVWIRIAILIGFFVLWECSAKWGWSDPFITSSPTRMTKTFLRLLREGQLARHVGFTLWETVIGFTLGTAIGIGAAVVLWAFPKACEVLDPYLVILNALPKTALGPVLIVWMGAGRPAIITMALLVSVVVTVMSVLQGFLSTDPELMILLRSLGATKLQTLTHVVLPANVPCILSALKVNVGLSWVGVIVGEFLVSEAGLGYLIVYGGQVFQLDLVMCATVILAVCAAVMYGGIVIAEKVILRKTGR